MTTESEPHQVSDDSRKPHPIDRHLEALLFRQRGQNGPLVREVLACLSPSARERLFRILQDLDTDRNLMRDAVSRRIRGGF